MDWVPLWSREETLWHDWKWVLISVGVVLAIVFSVLWGVGWWATLILPITGTVAFGCVVATLFNYDLLF